MMTDVFADTDRKTDAARSLATRARHASPSLRHEGARVREFEEGSSKGQSLCVCVDCYRVRHGEEPIHDASTVAFSCLFVGRSA